MIINTKPRSTRNDLLPSMELQAFAIADLKMPKHPSGLIKQCVIY